MAPLLDTFIFNQSNSVEKVKTSVLKKQFRNSLCLVSLMAKQDYPFTFDSGPPKRSPKLIQVREKPKS